MGRRGLTGRYQYRVSVNSPQITELPKPESIEGASTCGELIHRTMICVRYWILDLLGGYHMPYRMTV